mgnify:CR=1 FL=1
MIEQQLKDELLIRQMVERWAVWRDAGDWDRFATVWHPQGVMMATWFQGPFAEFIRVTQEGWAKGVSILHFLGGSAIEVAGDDDDGPAVPQRTRGAKACKSAPRQPPRDLREHRRRRRLRVAQRPGLGHQRQHPLLDERRRRRRDVQQHDTPANKRRHRQQRRLPHWNSRKT